MRLRTTIIAAVALCVVAGFAGCSKKVTKVEPAPQPAPVVEQPAPPPPVVQEAPKPDIDAQLREVLQTLYFDFDKSDLRPEAVETLGKIASLLSANPSVHLRAEGHADERGSSEYNMALGEKRARAAHDYLTSYGIGADRLETTSYGKERPAFPNCQDDACHAKNRRVEWNVLAK